MKNLIFTIILLFISASTFCQTDGFENSTRNLNSSLSTGKKPPAMNSTYNKDAHNAIQRAEQERKSVIKKLNSPKKKRLYQKGNFWLQKAKTAYNKQDFKNAKTLADRAYNIYIKI